MKGVAEPKDLERLDPEIHLGSGGFNLSSGSWRSTEEGGQQLAAELTSRLHDRVNNPSVQTT